MFPKNKWIPFQFEMDNTLITAKGWIGDRYERDFPDDTKVEIVSLKRDGKDVHDAWRYYESEALDYFKVNFEANS